MLVNNSIRQLFLQVVKQSNILCFGPKLLGTFVLYYPKRNICVEEN